MTRRQCCRVWLVAFLLATAGHAEEADLQDLGRRLYRDGLGTDGGSIVAVIGSPGVEVPGTAVACVRCHGEDGRGRPEGGVSPSDLTWEALTRPYDVTHPSGRRHPSYDARRLVRAVTMGLDPAGNELHVAMPRFRLSHADATALVAYLRALEDDVDPGVEDERLVLGTLLPLAGPRADMGQAALAVLRAWTDEINRGGGIYGRRLVLRVADAKEKPADRVEALERLLATQPIFAMVVPYTAGAEAEIAARAAIAELPVIAPLAGTSPASVTPGEQALGRRLERLSRQIRDVEVSEIRLWTLAAAEVVTEALERSGRRLSRETLIDALEAQGRESR